ncbi:hypothetical protein V8G54_018833, partial [Vigna mungo]
SDIPSLLRRRTLSLSRSLSSSLANSINLFCSNHEVAVVAGGVMEKATEKGKVLKVGLICGGPSAERGISLNSARSLLDHLQISGWVFSYKHPQKHYSSCLLEISKSCIS